MYTLGDMVMSIKGTADQIADWLRAEIESGAVALGVPLNQVELAERFGLSRIPVREALRQLEAEGYLTHRPNKGATVVQPLGAADLLEIIEIRECLELRIMQHCMRRVTPNVVARATEAMSAMNRAQSELEVRGAHERFHNAFFEVANRPKMMAIINDWRFRYHLAKQRSFLRSTRDVHRRLLSGYALGDLSAVTACIREEYGIIRRSVPPQTG